MTGWVRRIRGALGLGVVWAGGGAFIGGMVELLANIFPGLPVGFIDMWIQTLAIPGFLGGVIFSGVLGIAARDRRFDQLSVPHMVAWGTAGGVLLGGLMIGLGFPAFILAPATVLSALGAWLSLAFARMAERQERVDAGAEVEEIGLTDREARELLD